MNGEISKLKMKLEKIKMLDEIQNLKATSNGTVKEAATEILDTWF